MNNLEGVIRVAVLAQNGFGNATAIYFHSCRVLAHVTLKERFSHFRYERREADDHAADRYQLIDIWSKESFTTSCLHDRCVNTCDLSLS